MLRIKPKGTNFIISVNRLNNKQIRIVIDDGIGTIVGMTLYQSDWDLIIEYLNSSKPSLNNDFKASAMIKKVIPPTKIQEEIWNRIIKDKEHSPKPCPDCDGKGKRPNAFNEKMIVTCLRCNGQGFIKS